jgi:peptide/nickel transport system permease protein
MERKASLFLALSALLLVTFLAASLWPGLLASRDPRMTFEPYLPPSPDHLLGTNDVGYDIFAELIAAARVSLAIGVLSAVAAVVIGTIVGTLAGYSRGLLGSALTGLIDIVLLIPMLPLLITLAAYLGPSVWGIVLLISALGWCSTARAVRARVMQLREMPFVEALAALGIGPGRIIVGHIVPNVSEVVAAKFVLAVAWAMLSEASLSFMGLGDPDAITWGGMMHFAFHRGGFIRELYHWLIPPGLCIALCALAFVFIGLYLERRQARPSDDLILR